MEMEQKFRVQPQKCRSMMRISQFEQPKVDIRALIEAPQYTLLGRLFYVKICIPT